MASLFKRNNGVFYAAFNHGARRKWVSLRTGDCETAQKLFDSMKDTLQTQSITTLEGLAIELLRYASVNRRRGTVDLWRIALKQFTKSVGNKPLRFITPVDGERFKENLLKRVTPVSANVYLRTIKTIFNTAVRLGLMKENPLCSTPLLRVPPQEPAYLTKEQFAQLFLAIGDTQLQLVVAFAVLTGMRRGELVRLRWTQVDIERRLIKIRNTDDFTAKGMRPRTIPMNRDLTALINKMGRRSEYVFSDAAGLPLKASFVTKKFKQAVRKCGLSEKIHFHSLRHSYASWLVQASTPLAEVQRLLGHSSVVTTQIYSHLESEHLRDAAERISLS